MLFRAAAALLLSASLLEATPLALSHGEVMTFRVGCVLFIHAGEITISAHRDEAPPVPQLRVVTTTKTRGFLKNFFPFEAVGESWFSLRDGRILGSSEESVSKKKQTRQSLTFDYVRGKAAYVNLVRPERSTELDLPEGNPMDLISSLVQTRTWDLKPGEKQDALVVDDDFYELTIYADGYEEVRTPLGKFRALRLTPRMEKTEPKGMFKRGSEVHVWISQDGRRLPLKFEVDFKFGAGVATLIDHQIIPAIESTTAAAVPVAPVTSTTGEPPAPPRT